MHVPDGFLDGKTLAAAAALAAAGVGVALWNVRGMPPRRVPLMGLSAAFVFAGQMLNFPVAGGTSGHLLGGVLGAALLGPSAAVLVLTAVLLIQCLLFADGGLLALGANVLNMGIVDSVGGYIVYRILLRLMPGPRGRLTAVAFAAWFGAVLASVVCSGELVVSGTASARVVFPAMVGVHMLIGLGEAAITAIVIATVWQTRPEFLEAADQPVDLATGLGFPVVAKAGFVSQTPSTPGQSGAGNLDDLDEPNVAPPRIGSAPNTEGRAAGRSFPVYARTNSGSFLAYGLIVALALGIFVSPFASTWPDGLDRVAEKAGFGHLQVARRAPITDYQFPGINHVGIATAVAGLVGTVLAFGVALGLAQALVPRTRPALSGLDIPEQEAHLLPGYGADLGRADAGATSPRTGP